MDFCRRYPQAKTAYERVIKLEPRHASALGFLGMVYHLMWNLDAAIIKYHEASLPLPPSLTPLIVSIQALSIDPINGQILELLELALDSHEPVLGPFGIQRMPAGGEEEWARRMREHRKRGAAIQKERKGDEMNM